MDVFFDKAVFGGYDTTQVDEFVEEARKMISGLKKENEVLKQKLTILADKIEEYQAAEQTDDAVNSVVATVVVPPSEDSGVSDQQLVELRRQIAAEQSALDALMAEKTALAASIAKQYELCLQAMQGELAEGVVPEVTLDEVSALSATAEAEDTDKPSEVSVLSTEIPDESAEPADETAVTTDVVEDITETETIDNAADDPVEAAEAVSADTEESSEVSVQEVAEEPVAEEPISSIAETVEVGESVYLNTTAEDVATLSYEEALALVLKKNGIIRTTQTAQSTVQATPATKTVQEIADAIDAPKSEKTDDLQTTKIIPRIQSAQVISQETPVSKAEKPKKKKERSFLGNLRKTIHNFLEDASDDDLDVFTPVATKTPEKDSELQFGKAYNVKND